MTVYEKRCLNVFYCFAIQDQQLQSELDKQLNSLKTRGWIQSWHQGEIPPGKDQMSEVEKHLRTADIILLLLSADFFASELCIFQKDLAMQRHQAKEAIVIPILLRPVDWQNTTLKELQILPENGSPITTSSDRDVTMLEVANGIQMVVKTLLKGVYIASAPKENVFVLRLQQDLENQGILVWNSLKEPGLDREKKVQRMIRAVHMFVLIASPSAKYTRFIREELHIAKIYQKRIVPLWVAGNTWQESIPSDLVQNSYLDGRTLGDYENALGRILTLYKRVEELDSRDKNGPSISAPLPNEPRNPYKALRAFTSSEEDIRDFFGRERLTDDLVETMRDILTKQGEAQSKRFLIVIGPSGVGKSSVVMAGLLPRLQEGVLPGSEKWIYLTPMVPGRYPVESLALVLANKSPGESVQAIHTDLLAEEARGLYWQAFKLMKSPGTKVVLVVDQFEELFIQSSEEERQHFIDLLVVAATDPQSPVIIIATLRADFYDRPMNYPELRKLIETHSKLIPPMDIDELRSVIKEPAKLPDVQLSFDEDLVGDLLFEMRGQAGALPLLEFTLDQLFQRHQNQQLTGQAYQEIGGVKGALSKHAEETYPALPSEKHRQFARTLFLRLIDPGITEQDTTRRRAMLTELVFVDPEQTRLMQETIDAFVKARLLTTNAIEETETTIEVSHEALIREWPRLVDWLREARDDIRLQHIISEDAATWELNHRRGDRLYRGTQLNEARDWAKRNTVSKQEHTFLRASAAKQLRGFITAVTVLLLVITSSGIAAWLKLHQPPEPPKAGYVTTTNEYAIGSLLWAIANAHPGDRITFAPNLEGQTIALKNVDLHIFQRNLTIEGPETGHITIQAIGAGLIVDPSAIVTISDLTFQGSNANDQPTLIDNEGNLKLTSCIISSNTTATYTGGGIYNGGTLTITNSTISGNTAYIGGGILNRRTINITNSTISGNTSSSASSSGGGIFNAGSASISNSVISGNTVDVSYNAIPPVNFTYSIGISTIYTNGRGKNSIFGNTASGNSSGGGISNQGNLTIMNSTISNNSSSGKNSNGGGISSSKTLTIMNSTISGNSSLQGGGIENFGTTTITNSTISGNTSSYDGGGILNERTLDMTNSTLSGNTADSGNGGGIFIQSSDYSQTPIAVAHANFTFSTIYDNRASDGADIAVKDATYNSQNGALEPIQQISQVNMRNSILGGNDPQQNLIEGMITSGGHNVIQQMSPDNFDTGPAHATDQEVDDLTNVLGSSPQTQNINGITQTYYPLILGVGNPALNNVPLDACTDSTGQPVHIDQRGMLRPGRNKQSCDSGAYESQG